VPTLDELIRRGARGIREHLGLNAREARIEALALAAHALEANRAWLVAHGRDRLAGELQEKAEALFCRREAGEPVAYIVGTREFYGRPFRVTPATLIPRPETEHLVEAALARLPPLCPGPLPGGEGERIKVLDLGTGSGCIAITLKLERPDLAVTAVDVSAEALRVARGNAAALDAEVEWLESDLYAALGGRQFDLIASNPPYIPEADSHLGQGDLRFEPPGALASGPDGLDALRAIVREGRAHLAPGGWLLFEHGYNQGEAVQALLRQAGYAELFLERDLADQPRVSGGRRSYQP